LHDFTGQVIIKVYAYLDGDWRLLNTATFPDDFPDDVTVVQVEIPRAAQGVNRKITVQTPVNEGESRTIYYSEVTEHETDLTTEEEDYHEPD
jgi:hypothetical protein